MLKLMNLHTRNTVIARCSVAMLVSVLTGCSAGMADDTHAASTFHIRADANQTIAGGRPITLLAFHAMRGKTVSWAIESQSPGQLDGDEGDTVRYLPPAAGSIAMPAPVFVSATLGNDTQVIELSVAPWPAASLSVQRHAPRRQALPLMFIQTSWRGRF